MAAYSIVPRDSGQLNDVGCRPDHYEPPVTVRLLIAKGADVNVKSADGSGGRTPLHFAAYYGHEEIVELLISKGADVNTKTNLGGTPLNEAAVNGHKEIADLLRKHGGKMGEELKAEGK